MFQYQYTGRYFAQAAEGLEAVAVKEVNGLGAKGARKKYRGLYFEADPAELYRINYCSRLLTRVLAPILTFSCHSDRYLYKTAKTIDWPVFFGLEQTFSISASVSNSTITHSQYAGLKLKDAIVDNFRERFGRRPDVDTKAPDVRIVLRIDNNNAIISLDTSGGSLHRRGYREATVEAPMQETVAAAMVRLSGWDGERPLIDPLCGSGTILSEALMAYCRIPAGIFRPKFGFEQLPDFDEHVWRSVKDEADSRIRPVPGGLISGSDLLPDAVAAARTNLRKLPHGDRVSIRKADYRDLPGKNDALVIANPPYGIRTGRKEDMGAFYRELGDVLMLRFAGSSACIYCGNPDLLSNIGLRPRWKKPLRNGGLDGVLAYYDLHR